MKICAIYTSPKFGDIIFQLPFIKRLSEFYNCKITVCVNECIGIKEVLEQQDYVDEVIENFFRRKKNFIPDHFKLYKDLKKRKFNKVFIFEKTKGTTLACYFSGIKEINGYGIGIQKIFLNNKNTLSEEDLRYNYTEQSLKFLNKIGIDNVKFDEVTLKIKKSYSQEVFEKINSFKKPWVALAIDSNETNRIWPQKKFANLADKLIEKNMASHIFVINQKREGIDYFKNLEKYTKFKNKLFDCKIFKRNEIVKLINITDYFVGLDSGPSCIAGAIGKQTFCIIGPTDATLPRFAKMYKIVSDNYDKKRELGNVRCGDNFDKTDNEVKTIKVEKVLETIEKNLKLNSN